MKKTRAKQNRSRWFEVIKCILRIFFRRRKYLYLGEKPAEKSIIFSNHVGASAPVFHELYAECKIRFWGTFEMTLGFKDVYKYLRTTYLYEKKHIPIWLTTVLAGIIAPFTRIFYRGMKLIPTYKDLGFFRTVKLTETALNNGENIIIFPEDSHDGYHNHISQYFSGGFFAADKYTQKYGDIKIFNCYYIKKHRLFVISKGTKFSDLKEKYGNNYQEMAKLFCDQANEFGDKYRSYMHRQVRKMTK